MKLPVFDLHCDTALNLLDEKGNPKERLRRNDGHVDLERAMELGGYAQCFALFTFPEFEKWFSRPVPEVFQAILQNLLSELEQNRDLICQARSADEICTNQEQGRMSAILTLEGPAGIDYDPGKLEELYRLGFRISTLGWNEKNVLVGSHVTGGGLTDQGRAYVKECQRLGILVDVSHISDEGFRDILEITEAPIVASHSDLRSLCAISRNLTEDMYREICATGGTVGINLCPEFLTDGQADLDSACDHIFRMLELDPDGTHISLGGDLDGIDSLPRGFDGVQSYNSLADRLSARGLDEKTIRGIYWNNAMGVMDRAVRNHQK